MEGVSGEEVTFTFVTLGYVIVEGSEKGVGKEIHSRRAKSKPSVGEGLAHDGYKSNAGNYEGRAALRVLLFVVLATAFTDVPLLAVPVEQGKIFEAEQSPLVYIEIHIQNQVVKLTLIIIKLFRFLVLSALVEISITW